jgi:uncharacterized protein YukE
MPNWSPNWDNVKWDWGASDAAIGALRRAADRLESTAYQRTQAAAPAQQEWRGVYREQFDDELRSVTNKERELADECRRLANRVSSAAQEARDEQRRRERDRESWREEKREEERREREKREEERRRRRGG